MVDYEVLCASVVKVVGHEVRIRCVPVDSLFFVGLQYLSFPFFFDYEVSGERLLKALEEVAKKYPSVCGRVRPDSRSRYAIEITPATSQSHGFPFTEAKAEISIAETVLKHAKLKEESPAMPWSPSLPFFMEAMDLPETLKGNGPLLKIKLTHLTDGCVVNLTLAHITMDGERSMEFLRDLGKAYCGYEIPERDFDRSYQWPDRLVEHYPFLGVEVAKLPRICASAQQTVGFLEKNIQKIETEILVFTKVLLDKLNETVSPFLSQSEYVSRNDLMLALLWLFLAEVRAKQHPVSAAGDLPVHEVMAYLVCELLKSGLKLIPKNFCGNATLCLFLSAAENDLKGKSFSEALASLALMIRKTLNNFRTEPTTQAALLMGNHHLSNQTEFWLDGKISHASISNFSKTAVTEVDFGKGCPVLAHLSVPFPSHGVTLLVGPGPRNGRSQLVYHQFTEEEMKFLKDSVVIQTLAPELKRMYSDFTLEEIKELLGMI